MPEGKKMKKTFPDRENIFHLPGENNAALHHIPPCQRNAGGAIQDKHCVCSFHPRRSV